MSRYIEIDTALLKTVATGGLSAKALWRRIMEQPSIDICFCKECRYCKKKRGTFKGEPIIFYRCEEHNRDVENDDFCSWGEREDE